MKAFLSISFKQKTKFQKVIQAVEEELEHHSIRTTTFVNKYNFSSNESKNMMATALQEIQSCDIFLAEFSDKTIGIGIEAGYARALDIPIISFRKKGKPESTTLKGISSYEFEYVSLIDLRKKLNDILISLATFPK